MSAAPRVKHVTDSTVMPANAGIHAFLWPPKKSWIPAFEPVKELRDAAAI